MKLPFANLFQRAKGRIGSKETEAKVPVPIPVVKKPEGERLAKTVLPSAARVAQSEEKPTTAAAPTTIPTETQRAVSPPAVPVETQKALSITTEMPQMPDVRPAGNEKLETLPATPRPKISMGALPAAPTPHLPPAVAFALEPNIERAISLPLGDVIAQMPAGYLKPREALDVSRRVLLKAAEVEKGMATGQPAISIATLFQQAPDIFMHTVATTDGAMVALPFDRVLHELSSLSLRSDQAAEQVVPHVETPFLQAAMEDTQRFGTTLPVSAGAESGSEADESIPVRIEHASAEAFAAAVPEAKETIPTQKVSAATGGAITPEVAEAEQKGMAQANGAPSAQPAIRIPLTAPEEPIAPRPEKFGTGEPAFPRVPASSGPPVPSAPPIPATTARIPFNVPAPSDEVKKYAAEADGGMAQKRESDNKAADQPTAGTETEEFSANVFADPGIASANYHEPIVELPLQPILQNLPPMQLCGNPASVPAKAKVSFPLSAITPQLASGKIVVSPRAFYAVLPDEFRKYFSPDAIDAPVQLPLPDVLANLPQDALSVRDDQEIQTLTETFPTPFSDKAAEDAKRNPETLKAETLKADTVPTGMVQSVAISEPECAPEAPGTTVAAKSCAKEAVENICALPGIEACSVIFHDGFALAGNIAEENQGLSALAPTLLQKLEKHMLDTSLGRPLGMTVHGEKALVTFCTAGNICLTALHRGELGAVARRGLARIAGELSCAYSETPHVDH